MDKQMSDISEDAWQQFELICRFLEPFAKVTTVMSASKYPTIAAVIPLFNRLYDHLEDVIDTY